MNIHLGFEVGTGAPVEIPLAHTFVCGQTQLSGKTTTLRAIVERSGQRALAFVTKRGEAFDGQRIRPFLPRRSDQPIHWRMVETMLASALEQKNLKYERLWVINAAKGAFSLEDVQANVRRLLAKTKGDGRTRDIYTLLDEYLELVLPQMRALDASDQLELQPGLNVMDLSEISSQTQAMVIRAALERVNHHETEILTVLPEAWEFAPRGRSAPAKDEAIAMARKGAAPRVRNFLLVDSQDIAGVEPVIRQACSVWLIGVQRELNELKRGMQMIPAGVKRPKPEEIAQLEIGQFFACWGRHAVKVYVQPTWMNNCQARQVAEGALDVQIAAKLSPPVGEHTIRGAAAPKREGQVNDVEARQLRADNERLTSENADLRRRLQVLLLEGRRLDGLEQRDRQPRDVADQSTRPGSPGAGAAPAGPLARPALDGLEAAYSSFLARLVADAARDPVLLRVIQDRPELEVRVKRVVIEANGDSLRGRIARLLKEGFFDDEKTPGQTIAELQKRGAGSDVKFNTGKELAALANLGFLLRLGKTSDTKYEAVPGMTVNIVEVA